MITDAELLLYHLRRLAEGRLEASSLDSLEADIRRAQSMMVEFFGAHRENPDQLKPAGYWYGHQYSYLTRDMIDLTKWLIARSNRLIRQVQAPSHSGGEELEELSVPPLLAGRATGRFLEYPHVGRTAAFSRWQRFSRLGRWVIPSWKMGRRKQKLAEASLEVDRRKEMAWGDFIGWGEATLRLFDVQVKVQIDPEFFPIAEALELKSGVKKILFLPTHQSLLDHAVLYQVLGSSDLLAAMGWERPVSCVILARTRLADAGVKIGPWSLTMFGVSAKTFDHLLEEVDGYVTLERSKDAAPTTQRFVRALEEQPGLTYPAGTIAAFDVQSPPLQHALFALLPQDVVIIPIALRGIHSLWPKCPKGNLHINPGLVEVVVSPPMPGETTLLPRRRSLRTQVESAALFQAVHITTLLNPEPSEP